ncbi:MAG: MBOAT family O-acyltransferase [Lachnospiraceae bacterium]
MIFSSVLFLFAFLPVVIALYYLSDEKYRNGVLLVASLLFYAYSEPKFIFVMMISVALNYIFALWMDKSVVDSWRKIILILSLMWNIGILFIYKYLDFSITISNDLLKSNCSPAGIILPIGISFFTFQIISYEIDVYRKAVPVQHNIWILELYISFFPKLSAGPIVRYHTFEKQIQNRSVNWDLFGAGAKRLLCGLCKKVILANNLSIVAEKAFADHNYAEKPVLLAWLGAICFSLRIFYDFSGYSDMAIGLGKMFGFEFEENFNYPYISKTVTEFWRRWHISLGRWFRDYVYIPLGGSHCSTIRHIFNLFLVWLLTGIWHGANYTFIVWGLSYFVLQIIEKYLIHPEEQKWPLRNVWQILTLLFVIFEWVIFYSDSLANGIRYCLSMFGFYYGNAFFDSSIYVLIREYGWYIVMAVLFSAPVGPYFEKKLAGLKRGGKILEQVVVPLIYVFGFIWSISFLALGAHNPFLYFKF